MPTRFVLALRSFAALVLWLATTWFALVIGGVARLEQFGSDVATVMVGLGLTLIMCTAGYLTFVLLVPARKSLAFGVVILSMLGANLVVHAQMHHEERAFLADTNDCTKDGQRARAWPFEASFIACKSGRRWASD
jgi:hypothetical protein